MDLPKLLAIEGMQLTLIPVEPDIQAVNTIKAKPSGATTADATIHRLLIKRNVGAYKAGAPDIFIPTMDGAIFVEVKGPGDNLTQEQLDYLGALALMPNTKVYVARYKLSEELDSLLNHKFAGNTERNLVYEAPTFAQVTEALGNPDWLRGVPSWPPEGVWQPRIGPEGGFCMLNLSTGVSEYGHNATRKLRVALHGDGRKY